MINQRDKFEKTWINDKKLNSIQLELLSTMLRESL